MSAATFIIPTVLWVLPLMLGVGGAWIWAWHRYLTPVLIRRHERLFKRRMRAFSADRTEADIDELWQQVLRQSRGQ